MVGTLSKTVTNDILSLNRSQIRQVMGLITGHCPLRKHMHQMGIYTDEPICRLCNEEEEIATHVILECEALARWRYNLLGAVNSQEAFSKNDLVERLLNLIKVANLFT